MVLLTLFNTLIASAQLTVDAGNDTTFCGLNFQLGGSPTASGGTPPYAYVWETSYSDAFGSFTASTFLNDTTIANPSLIFPEANDKLLTFKLTVTDALNNIIVDSSKANVGFYPFVTHLSHGVGHINAGDSIMLEPGGLNWGSYPFTYEWSPNYNLSDSTIENPWAKPNTTTEYYCTLTSITGCRSPLQYSQVYVNPLAVEEASLNKSIKLYPNPSSNQLVIEGLGHQEENIIIDIKSVTGKLALTQKVINFEKTTVNTSEIPSGVYIVTIREGKNVVKSQKWVKISE